jgi:hypothetical protein
MWCPFARIVGYDAGFNRESDGEPSKEAKCIEDECAAWREIYDPGCKEYIGYCGLAGVLPELTP